MARESSKKCDIYACNHHVKNPGRLKEDPRMPNRTHLCIDLSDGGISRE